MEYTLQRMFWIAYPFNLWSIVIIMVFCAATGWRFANVPWWWRVGWATCLQSSSENLICWIVLVALIYAYARRRAPRREPWEDWIAPQRKRL